ncbi:MAG TPA: hypothetical protein VKZ53_27300 [Candidatus Angelobacter sp.]|nr:hypothetical protein [Candidatus Angelobacter sp.]
MPIIHDIDSRRRVVFTACIGSITIAEIDESTKRLRNDPAFDPDLDQIVDLSQLSSANLSYETLSKFSRYDDPFSGNSRRAIVAPSTFAFGMARMYQALVDDPKFAVVKTMEQARQWLGLDAAE